MRRVELEDKQQEVPLQDEEAMYPSQDEKESRRETRMVHWHTLNSADQVKSVDQVKAGDQIYPGKLNKTYQTSTKKIKTPVIGPLQNEN